MTEMLLPFFSWALETFNQPFIDQNSIEYS